MKYLDKKNIPVYAYYEGDTDTIFALTESITTLVKATLGALNKVDFNNYKYVIKNNLLKNLASEIVAYRNKITKLGMKGVVLKELLDSCDYTVKLLLDVDRRKEYFGLIYLQAVVGGFAYNLRSLTSSLLGIEELKKLDTIMIVPQSKLQKDLSAQRGIVLNELHASDFISMEENKTYLVTTPIVSVDEAGFMAVFTKHGDRLDCVFYYGLSSYVAHFSLSDLSHVHTEYTFCKLALNDFNSLAVLDKRAPKYSDRVKLYRDSCEARKCNARQGNLCDRKVCIKSNKYSYNCLLGTYRQIYTGTFITVAEMTFMALNYLKDSLVAISSRKSRGRRTSTKKTSATKVSSSVTKTPVKEMNSIALFYNSDSLDKVYSSRSGLQKQLNISRGLGVSKSPHVRQASVRHLADGRVVNVKACVIHKDKYNGVTGVVIG